MGKKPIFTHQLLTKHLTVGSKKHKKLGYQMLKDKYFGKGKEVKTNFVKGEMLWFLVKGSVNAAMKINIHILYMFI